jgi:leucyl/phenylalanyl-tRNA---protein transferase
VQRLTPELIVAAYAEGLFPMGISARSPVVRWMEPEARGVMPLEGLRISRSLARRRRRGGFRFSADTAFDLVVAACADRPETWINPPIARVFGELHALGLAHSVEVWEDGALAGGVYGLALNGAFFAESMVSGRTDGSKLALAELVARLRAGGYRLMDTQYLTPHLASLGGVEIGRAEYRRRLADALATTADPARAFGPAAPAGPDGAVWRL